MPMQEERQPTVAAAATSTPQQPPPPPPPLPQTPLMVMNVAAVNRFVDVVLAGDVVVGRHIELRATEQYFAWYFPAQHVPSGRTIAHCHISMMHSRAHRALQPGQLDRLVLRAQRLLPAKPVLLLGEHTLEFNTDGSLRRSYCDIQGTSDLAQELWQLRNMICNWLGPAYGERHRTAFHLSIDGVEV
jgi:hypothetical protein